MSRIDAVLAEFDDGRFVRVAAHYTGRYDPALRQALVDLSREATPVALDRLATLDRQVADAFADAALGLLTMSGVPKSSIVAAGSHGQTIFHDPVGAKSSLQLGDPSRIAARVE